MPFEDFNKLIEIEEKGLDNIGVEPSPEFPGNNVAGVVKRHCRLVVALRDERVEYVGESHQSRGNRNRVTR